MELKTKQSERRKLKKTRDIELGSIIQDETLDRSGSDSQGGDHVGGSIITNELNVQHNPSYIRNSQE